MATIREVKGNPNQVWDDLSWTDINEAEQALWGNLGWNKDSWEEETEPPESDDKYWEDLSTQEQEAAKKLGYTKESWDQD
jgi:hypothetical protein